MPLPKKPVIAFAVIVSFLVVGIILQTKPAIESLKRHGNDNNQQKGSGYNLTDPVVTNRLPASSPFSLIALLQPDSPASDHPVERAVAMGTVLDTRVEVTPKENNWSRIRLVKSAIQPRLLRVVEFWRFDPITAKLACLKREMFLADQLIVRLAEGIHETDLQKKLEARGMILNGKITDGLVTVQLGRADLDATPTALRFFSEHPEIAESAEPDGVGFGGGIPNDPRFSEQWGLHNTGQSGGVIDADVNAPELWDILESTPGITVAVLDSGLNFTHPDLQNIGGINPGEIAADGLDNDFNGKIDDVMGWDFVNDDQDSTDDHGHGSNVTGIIAANRNNEIGIAGMLDGVKILVCKILNAQNSGLTSNLIAATTYARQLGVPVMNLSLQNYPYSNVLDSEFTACESAGIVLVICAGNQGFNNDLHPNYPSCYSHSNIIAVGNHHRTDSRWLGLAPSNYGAVNVDLFAPGWNILAPILGTSYSGYTGTSQATPHVTAICCAIKYANPTWAATQIKQGVLSSVIKKASYDGICVTGGRLDSAGALSFSFYQNPAQDTDGDGFPNLFEYLAGTRVDILSNHPKITREVNNGFLKIAMPRILQPGANFVIETSSDLAIWTSVGVEDCSTPTILMGGIPLSLGQRSFLRIRADPNLPQPP